MKISVITVVLDELDELIKTHNSILKQCSDEIEWVVVHGGDDVSVAQYINDNRKSLKTVFISEPDNGIYDAMNKGVKLCDADYVVFLNAGDVFSDPEVIQDVSSVLSKSSHVKVDVLCCSANLVLSDDRKVLRPAKNVRDYIWHGLPANHQATYYRKESIIKFPYDLKYKLCGDYYIAAIMYENNMIFENFDRVVVDFYLDGISYNWRLDLFKEPFLIQRDILNLNFRIRVISLLKRFISNAALRLFQVPYFGKFVCNLFELCKMKKTYNLNNR